MQHTADEIKSMLNARAEQFCGQFLSRGRSHGKLWRCGNILNSDSGKSFVVTIAGAECGLWYENGTPAAIVGKNGGKSGTLIDILIAQKRCNFAEALKAAKEWLGIYDDKVIHRWEKQDAPERQEYISVKNLTPAAPGSPAWEYLTGERGIPGEILKKYGVCDALHWFPGAQKKLNAMAFPVKSPDGKEVLNVKYIAFERTEKGGKHITQESGGTNHLMFMNAVSDDARDIVICEGEIDALTIAAAGFNAVSVPAGAHGDKQDGEAHKNNEWLKNDYDWLANFEEIRLCFDNDDKGKEAERSLYFRLGIERTLVVAIPELDFGKGQKVKDPNGLAQYSAENGADPFEAIREVVNSAESIDPEMLKRADKYRADVHKLMFPPDGKPDGRYLPNCNFGEHFMIRDGEITIGTGFAGHGKSEFLNDLIVSLCADGERACIGSFETPPARTLFSMWKQAVGMEKPVEIDEAGNEHEIDGLYDKGFDWLNERMFFYDYIGTAESKKVIAAFEYAAKRYGVKIFVVDSLMCMDVDEEDTQRQKQIMNEFREFVIKYNVHLFLVAHSRKTGEKKREESYIPSKHDILGSVHIGNLAWNIISVWRNVSKEERHSNALNKIQHAASPEAKKKAVEDAKRIFDENDTVVAVRKQRNGGGGMPHKQLWFDPDSKQFRGRPKYEPRNYLKHERDRWPDTEKYKSATLF